MAQKIIFTQYFRIGPFANLGTPYARDPAKDVPKYSVTALFPKNGITKPTGQPTSGVADILAALNEVCLAEFKVDYNTFMSNHVAYGVQYPPRFSDGDQDWQKDQNDNPLIGQVRPESMGMWKLPMKSPDPVDLVSPNGQENVSPAQMYSGCWARAQISVDAYVTKANHRVFSIKLLNLQLAYDDEKLATAGGVKPVGTQSFANMAVAGTNVQPAFNGIPQNVGQMPGMMPQQGMPAPGQMPMQQPGMMPQQGMPAPGQMPMQQPGMMPMQQQMPGTSPTLGVGPGMMPQQGMPAPGQMPMQQAPAAAVQHRVIMNPGEHPYENYKAANWTDEMLVSNGKATWNYNYVGG